MQDWKKEKNYKTNNTATESIRDLESEERVTGLDLLGFGRVIGASHGSVHGSKGSMHVILLVNGPCCEQRTKSGWGMTEAKWADLEEKEASHEGEGLVQHR